MKTGFFIFYATLASLTIRISTFASCLSAPAGLAAWWQAEGNANDSANANAGTMIGSAVYASGKVGLSFSFNGSNACLNIPASSSLDVGNGNGLTVETWINPADVLQAHPIIQWNDASASYPYFGASFWISVPPTNGGTGSGCLLVDLKSTTGAHRMVCSTPGIISASAWQHVAATYDKTSGVAVLYLNGVPILQTNLGNITPATSQDLWIGREQNQIGNDKMHSIGNGQAWFEGQIDELSIYNRALSALEIQSVFNADIDGKCPLAPSTTVILPATLAIAEGETGAFAVVASGSPPLTFQWAFNGTNVSNATNSSLVFTNTLLSQGGNYFVRVSNAIGSTVSASATLTVLPSYQPTWRQTTAPTNLNWAGLACSSDGKRITAVSYDGYIYSSSDAGLTWVSNNVPKLTWYAVTCSEDGRKLAAAAGIVSVPGATVGGIYTSTNYGVTWHLATTGSYNIDYLQVVGSKDGNKLMAVPGNGDTTHLYVSTNAGFSWMTISRPYQSFRLACSADGNTIVGADTGNKIYVSTNFGSSWVLTSAPSTNYWVTFTSSASGKKLFAGAMYDMQGVATNAYAYASADAGQNWAAYSMSKHRWDALACSDDGTKLVGGEFPGYLYFSSDSGTNWTVTRAPSSYWSRVASSADGTLLVAGQWPGSIYIWQPTTLDISVLGANVVVSWPTNVPNFILQQKSGLDSSNWFNVTNTPSVTNAYFQVALPLDDGSKLFRLVYP